MAGWTCLLDCAETSPEKAPMSWLNLTSMIQISYHFLLHYTEWTSIPGA